MGVDTLHLGASQFTRFRPVVVEVMRGIDWERGSSRTMRSRHYAGVLDLRPFGIDALLHAYNKHTQPRNHKLELIDAGKKPYSEVTKQIEAVFDTNPDNLRVMRIDLCADVFGTHVSWFQPRARIKYKRFAREIGELKYEQMGERSIQTLVAGKRPNMFRLYDKTAECISDFQKRLRKLTKESDPLEFENEYGFPPDAVLTRVERQIGGGRIPDELSAFGCLVREAANFNPFEPIEIIAGPSDALPGLHECDFMEWVAGTRLNQLGQEWGMQQLRTIMNRETNGNGSRIMKRYERFFPRENGNLTTEKLFELYRESITKQFAA